LHLARLHQIEAALPQQSPPPPPDKPAADAAAPVALPATPAMVTETVWATQELISALPAPIDEPEKLLVQLKPAGPLTPGVYGVHWGALEGHASTDPFVFLFRVADPAPPEGEKKAEPAAKEEKGKPKQPPKTAPKPAEKPPAPVEDNAAPDAEAGAGDASQG
jgi:hypothetical protein